MKGGEAIKGSDAGKDAKRIAKSGWVHGTGLALLFLWACVFSTLLATGQYRMYLTPAFWPLLLLALILLGLFLAARIARGRICAPIGSTGVEVVRTGLLLLPLLYLAGGHGESLGSFAFGKRNLMDWAAGMGSIADGLPSGNAALEIQKAAEGNGIERNLLELQWNFVRLSGKKIRTLGQATKDESLPRGYFVLFRFVISCCVADARPVALPVAYTEGNMPSSDDWVRVEGVLRVEEFRGRKALVIRAESVEKVEAPRDIYLYGN